MLRRPLSGDALASDSARVAAWTAVSRVTGFVRAVAVAAVLGPTFLGSLFQATYVLPALIYQMLVGSLFVALLVPAQTRGSGARSPRCSTPATRSTSSACDATVSAASSATAG